MEQERRDIKEERSTLERFVFQPLYQVLTSVVVVVGCCCCRHMMDERREMRDQMTRLERCGAIEYTDCFDPFSSHIEEERKEMVKERNALERSAHHQPQSSLMACTQEGRHSQG